MTKFKKGTQVEWAWGRGAATGRIAEIFTERVTLEIKGAHITRNANPDNPAYRIEQANGNEVLKSHSELHEA